MKGDSLEVSNHILMYNPLNKKRLNLLYIYLHFQISLMELSEQSNILNGPFYTKKYIIISNVNLEVSNVYSEGIASAF